MGITRINIRVCRIDRPEMCKTVRGVVVDTGATVSAIPSKVIKELGIQLPVSRRFILATGRSVSKRIGVVWIEYDGRKAADEVVAITKGTPLLSVRALEGLGFEVDPTTRRLRKLEGSLLL